MNKKQKREQTTLRLPAELKRQLQQEATENGIGLNAYLLLIIRQYLKNRH